MTVRSRRAADSRGQALVEFSLVFVPFIFLLFGLIDLGRLVYINNALSEAAREGARWGTVNARSVSAADRTTIGARTRSSLAAVPNPTVTVTCEDSFGTAKSTCSSQNVLVVQVQANVGMITPLVAQLLGPRTYTATSRMTVQN